MLKGLLPTRGGTRQAVELLMAEFAGDALSRVATKFGLGNLLATLKIPATFTLPATRIAVAMLGPRVLAMAPRMFKPSFRASFQAMNLAQGLIAMTNNMRTRVFQSAGLAGYELADWETASGGVGDWETASGGVGMLGTPPPGVFDYDDGDSDDAYDAYPAGVF
jgi:hypothetical protein